MLRCLIGLLAACLCGTWSSARGDNAVYKYIDKNGRIIFTDKKYKGSYQLIWSKPKDDLIRDKPIVKHQTPAPSKPVSYRQLAADVARRHGLEPALMDAVIQTESAYNPQALSKTGAMGLMQLMPDTAARFAVQDPWDPEANLQGGATYLKHLIKLFDENLELALAAYNAGENAVKRHGNQIPPYAETQNYVKKVMRLYRAARPEQP